MSFSGIMDTLAPILKFSSTWFLCISPNGTPQEFWDIWDKRLPLPVNWTREESPGDIQKMQKHVEAMRPYDSDFLEFLHDGVSQWFSVLSTGRHHHGRVSRGHVVPAKQRRARPRRAPRPYPHRVPPIYRDTHCFHSMHRRLRPLDMEGGPSRGIALHPRAGKKGS